jgi:LysR family transcriptional regulator, nitrogen assimilation regulatory protein
LKEYVFSAEFAVELRGLAYLVTACRSLSLADGASRLGIAVSTLSAVLKSVEGDSDVVLFHRRNNALYPNAAALALIRAVEPLLIAEQFARRWSQAPPRATLKILRVEVALSHTIGGIAAALRRAADTFAAERPDVLVDPVWIDERDRPVIPPLTAADGQAARFGLRIGIGGNKRRSSRGEIKLLDDRWVFASRLPAGTQTPPRAGELAAGRLIVPLLSPPLIDQADRYLSCHRFPNVRFVNDHPAELPRLIEERPDAAVFVPRTVAAARLGLAHVTTVEPDEPLRLRLTARPYGPAPLPEFFARHLRRALSEGAIHVERPVLTLRQIHYAAVVQRVRRIASAARACNISQPALSQQIRKIEGALGGALFERRGDGVLPTPRGERFAEMAALIEARSRRLSGSEEGVPAHGRRIAFGILPSVSQRGFLVNRITDAIVSVQTRHQGLKIVVQEGPNGALQDWVTRDLIGVAIVETALPHMPRLPLGSSEELAAVAHPSHRVLPEGPVTLAALARQKLVLPTGRSGLRQLLDAAAEARNLKIRPVLEIDALPMAVALLARMPVCTVLPPSAIANEVTGGDLVVHPIVEPSVSRRLFFIYSADRALSPPERDLVNVLRRSLSSRP